MADHHAVRDSTVLEFPHNPVGISIFTPPTHYWSPAIISTPTLRSRPYPTAFCIDHITQKAISKWRVLIHACLHGTGAADSLLITRPPKPHSRRSECRGNCNRAQRTPDIGRDNPRQCQVGSTLPLPRCGTCRTILRTLSASLNRPNCSRAPKPSPPAQTARPPAERDSLLQPNSFSLPSIRLASFCLSGP